MWIIWLNKRRHTACWLCAPAVRLVPLQQGHNLDSGFGNNSQNGCGLTQGLQSGQCFVKHTLTSFRAQGPKDSMW